MRKDLEKKMQQLGVVGWSSMGQFTPDELIERLQDVEKVVENRKVRAKPDQKESNGEES